MQEHVGRNFFQHFQKICNKVVTDGLLIPAGKVGFEAHKQMLLSRIHHLITRNSSEFVRIAQLALDEARSDKQIADFPFLNNLATAFRFNSQIAESEKLFYELFKSTKSKDQQKSTIVQVMRLFKLDLENILLGEKSKWKVEAAKLGINWNEDKEDEEDEEDETWLESPLSIASFPPLHNFSSLE